MPIPLAALLIPTIGSAVASIFGAKKAADASTKAAEIQSDYGQQALKLFEDIYKQQRADQEPFRQGGMQALNAVLAGGGYAPVGLGSSPAATNPNMNLSASAVRTNPDGTGYVPATAGAKWYPPTDEAGSGWPPSTVNPYTGSSYAGGLVTMQAPDGTIKDVPQSEVAHYQSLGATVVQG